MQNSEPADLSAVQAVRLIAKGSLTSEALMRSCLERIVQREPEVQAFEHLEIDTALAEARAADMRPSRQPLRGLPFAAKDNYDTFDMPTTSGSPIYAGNNPACDASTVALARSAGAILVGKTVATEFAYIKPAKTRNPHDTSRVPGVVFRIGCSCCGRDGATRFRKPDGRVDNTPCGVLWRGSI